MLLSFSSPSLSESDTGSCGQGNRQQRCDCVARNWNCPVQMETGEMVKYSRYLLDHVKIFIGHPTCILMYIGGGKKANIINGVGVKGYPEQ